MEKLFARVSKPLKSEREAYRFGGAFATDNVVRYNGRERRLYFLPYTGGGYWVCSNGNGGAAYFKDEGFVMALRGVIPSKDGKEPNLARCI